MAARSGRFRTRWFSGGAGLVAVLAVLIAVAPSGAATTATRQSQPVTIDMASTPETLDP